MVAILAQARKRGADPMQIMVEHMSELDAMGRVMAENWMLEWGQRHVLTDEEKDKRDKDFERVARARGIAKDFALAVNRFLRRPMDLPAEIIPPQPVVPQGMQAGVVGYREQMAEQVDHILDAEVVKAGAEGETKEAVEESADER